MKKIFTFMLFLLSISNVFSIEKKKVKSCEVNIITYTNDPEIKIIKSRQLSNYNRIGNIVCTTIFNDKNQPISRTYNSNRIVYFLNPDTVKTDTTFNYSNSYINYFYWFYYKKLTPQIKHKYKKILVGLKDSVEFSQEFIKSNGTLSIYKFIFFDRIVLYDTICGFNGHLFKRDTLILDSIYKVQTLDYYIYKYAIPGWKNDTVFLKKIIEVFNKINDSIIKRTIITNRHDSLINPDNHISNEYFTYNAKGKLLSNYVVNSKNDTLYYNFITYFKDTLVKSVDNNLGNFFDPFIRKYNGYLIEKPYYRPNTYKFILENCYDSLDNCISECINFDNNYYLIKSSYNKKDITKYTFEFNDKIINEHIWYYNSAQKVIKETYGGTEFLYGYNENNLPLHIIECRDNKIFSIQTFTYEYW